MPLLFSYGTLQQEKVQLSTFGRRLKGERDELPRFEQSLVRIEDPKVAAAIGQTHHANVKFNGNEESRGPARRSRSLTLSSPASTSTKQPSYIGELLQCPRQTNKRGCTSTQTEGPMSYERRLQCDGSLSRTGEDDDGSS